jgi:chromodomain-helicase-DNA-binding protein 4
MDALSRFSSNDQTNSRAIVLESEDEESSFKDARALRKRNLLSLQNKRKAEMASRSASVDELSEDEIVISASSIPRRSARATRSQGLGEVQMLPYNDTGRYSDDDLAPERPIRRSSRPATRNAAAQEFFKKKSRGRKGDSDDDYESEEGVTRRSDRTKRQNVQYTEVNPEDDFEETVEVRRPKPKVLHSKEIFPVLQDDEFAELHNPQCDTCKYIGHSKERGTLVYCQGCSATFHKDCIGQRTWRDHLVTKISSENFVLQCKRCIGKYKLKDSLEASYDRCTVCHQQGLSCKPFKSLKEKKKAPAHDSRELTPDTSVDEDLLYNPQNVLFRCSECFRAWHYEHLPPPRGSKPRQGETKEDREKRVREYIENFQCIECSTKPGKLSNIIAWRPADPVAREGGETTDLSLFDEDEREYLIKFEDQSYFHAKWYPGPWVAGAFPQKRRGFLKSNPSAIMTREEAIPEDWLRVEIVLDVQYTSIVPHGDVEVDLRRVREVEKALIKYRGLPYEQVFWDDPPKESDKERWAPWARAYEDYIRGMYIHPPKNIAKRVEKARRSKFCPLKAQPKYITGGTLMEYQMEGMK